MFYEGGFHSDLHSDPFRESNTQGNAELAKGAPFDALRFYNRAFDESRTPVDAASAKKNIAVAMHDISRRQIATANGGNSWSPAVLKPFVYYASGAVTEAGHALLIAEKTQCMAPNWIDEIHGKIWRYTFISVDALRYDCDLERAERIKWLRAFVEAAFLSRSSPVHEIFDGLRCQVPPAAHALIAVGWSSPRPGKQEAQ